MKISIVIPVYNEAASLVACLEAIKAQTTNPYEVIIVDNNSTDETVTIAAQYDFVRLLHERRQGVVHARTTGFNAATGDIIARIDADSIVPTDWLATIAEIFTDDAISATSGIARYYNVAAVNLINGIDLSFRRYLSKHMGKELYLWGSNMAMRASAWQRVRSRLCVTSGIHEDFDIAIHVQAAGGIVSFDERLVASVSSRRIDVGFMNYLRYIWASPRTYAVHKLTTRRYMYPIIAFCALTYLPGRLLYRGYDPVLHRFSWQQLLFSRPVLTARVDPTANVA